jgi:hypothetical protein
MGDGLITGPVGDGDGDFGGQMNKSWDGIRLARVRRSNAGWTAEVEHGATTWAWMCSTT